MLKLKNVNSSVPILLVVFYYKQTMQKDNNKINITINDVEELYNLGRELSKQGKKKEALEKIKSAAKQNHLSSINYMAIHYLVIEKNLNKAKTYVFKAIKISNTNRFAIANLGIYYFNINEINLSLELLLKAKNNSPSHLDFYIGNCYLYLEQYQAAINIFESILQTLSFKTSHYCGYECCTEHYCICLEPPCVCLECCSFDLLQDNNIELQKSKMIFKSERRRRINLYKNLGICYFKIENYVLASSYFDKACNDGCKETIVLLLGLQNFLGNKYLRNTYLLKIIESKNVKTLSFLITRENIEPLSVIQIHLLIIDILREKYETSVKNEKKVKYNLAIKERQLKLFYFYEGLPYVTREDKLLKDNATKFIEEKFPSK